MAGGDLWFWRILAQQSGIDREKSADENGKNGKKEFLLKYTIRLNGMFAAAI